MKVSNLDKIKKLYFTPIDVASALGISNSSGVVACNRYVKQGFIIRIKRNFYVTKEKWNYLSQEELFEIANILQVPSYISLSTALSFYDLSTQIQQNFVESISLKRTKQIKIKDRIFNYSKIKEKYYFSFSKDNNFFISNPEKAFLDCLYLQYLGRYNLDISALDIRKIDLNVLKDMILKYPKKIQEYFKKIINLL